MGQINKVSVVVGAQRRAEKKYLLSAETCWLCFMHFQPFTGPNTCGLWARRLIEIVDYPLEG